MKYKKSMIIIMLVIFLFSIAAASASDVNETAMASENSDQSNDLNSVQMSDSATHNTIESSEKIDTLNLNDNEEKLTAGNIWYVNSSAANGEGTLDNPFNNLKDTITASSDNDIIRIASGTYSGENNANLIIDKNLTLERYGDGEAVFDGSGSYGIWEIQAKSINMTGFTFQNGYGGNGGALLFKSELINSNINANFNNNYAVSSGGAIYFAEFLTNVNIIGNFTKNNARGTGYDGEGGGAICFFAELNHVNIIGNFTDNIAQSYAGANYFKSKITNVNIFGNYNNNTATGQNGGANWFSALLNVNIIGNYSNNKAYFGGANVFYEALENVNITGNYINNTATNFDGGANQFRESLKNVAITGDYSYNKAKSGGANWFSDTGSLNNVNITGNYCHNEAREDGGAIYLGKPVHVNIIGNYTNNTAKTIALYGGGGAIFVLNSPTELTIAANFYNNTAVSEGAAILFYNSMSNVDVTGNFINNKGKSVIYNWGTSNSIIHDSIFINNSKINVDGSGTIKIVNTWFGNNATNYDTAPGENRINFENWLFLNATVDSNIDDDSKITNITFKLSSYNSSGVSDYNNNLLNPINLTITATNGNIAATARLGETIQFTPTSGGTATVTATVENAIQTVEIPVKGDFDLLQDLVNNESLSVINLERNYTYNQFDTMTEGVVINRAITINGNGYTINANGKTRIFKITSDNVVLENITFVNGNTTSTGGAVYFSKSGGLINCNFTGNTASNNGGAIRMDSGTVSNCNFADNTADYGGAVYFKVNGEVTNCNFTNNSASNRGGAVYFYGNGDVTNCNFTNNSARYGGAIEFDGTGTVTNCNFVDNHANRDGGAIWIYSGTVSNCNFTGNNATTGSAIYFYKWDSSATLTVSNSTFLNNRANARALDIVKTESNITITFTGQNNLLNAIYSIEDAEVAFTNVTYWGAKGITTVSDTMSGSNKATGQNITVGVVVNNELVLSDVMVTDKNGMIVLDISAGENYYISARHNTDSYYTEAERTISNNTKFSVNVTSQTTTNKTVNITAKSNIPNDVVQGKLLFILPNGTQIEATYGDNGTWWAEHTFDAYGEYKVNASYVGLDNVTVNDGTITINKVNSTITLENIVLDYGETKNVTVTTTGATGITAKIDGNDVTVINNYTIQIPVLDAGTYNLTVTTIPDDDHNPVTKEVDITVNKVNSTLTVNDIVFDYGSSGSTVVSITGANGVNATVVEQPKAVVKVNGTNITVSGLDAGTYTLTVTTIPDKNHNNITKNATITVNKVNATLTVNDVVLDYGESKNITVTAEGTTGITAKIDGVDVAVNNYTILISELKAGNHTLSVTTIPDDNHNPVNVTSKIIVNKVESTLTVDDIVFDYDGEGSGDVSFTGASEVIANVVNQPSAVVSVNDNKISVSGLGAGSYTLNVTTVPDENHTAVTETATITVNKVNSTLTLDDVVLDYGDSKNVTVATEGATGITAKIDGVDVTVNGYTIPISGLSAGNYTLTVTTIADANHNNITKNATITVNKVNATLTVNDVVLDYGESKNITVTTEGATGITAKIDGVNVTVNGYTIPISGLGAGNYTLTVTTIADKNHNPVTKEVNITVNKLSTEIILANETLDLKVGDEVTDLANLTPAGAGNLTLTSSDEDLVFIDDDGIVIGNGQGQAIITVSFAGNENYTAAENKTITVNVELNDASVSVENDTLNLKVDETSAINATIEPDTIMLKIKYTSSDDSVATVDKNGIVTAVGEGRAIITLEVGDDEIYAKNSTTVTVTVNKINTTADVSIPENITVGDNSTVNVILPADATGNVTVKVDGEVVDTVPVKDGNADVTIPSMSAGNHTVEIAYSGDGKYNLINETKEISVSKKDITPEIIIPSDMRFGDNATVDIKLPDDASGNVTLTVDGKEINTVPVTNGTASVKLPALDAGNHTAEIAYSGDDKYKPASKTTTISIDKDSTKITAADVTATYKVDKYLVITLKDSKGNPLANASVTVDLNTIKNYTTDENGQIKIKVSNLLPKTYDVKITFAGDNNYLGSDATAKVVVKKATPKITASNKMFKTTAKSKKYTITLKDNTGKPIKNAKVYLKVNGKTYKATTNSKGKATFKITKLSKTGTFKATVTYKGNKYYNKATKKVTVKVISAFKTISKGSKAKSTVKEIQRALKNHGYYLTAYGHYLKVDGIYWDYTVKAVKQFQKAKGLKVTGKVDEKTAKKLGII